MCAALRLPYLLALLAVAFPVWSATLSELRGHYVIDPGSTIGFEVPQIGGGGGLSGRFGAFSGEFNLEPGAIGRSRVAFTLRPASVATGQKRIDGFLRSDAVFDVAAYPVITFRSSEIVQSSADTAIVEGMLQAHGITHPETFEVRLLQRSGSHVVFHVTGRIPRSRYGMDVGTPIYSNVVAFDMLIRGNRR